MKRDQLRSLNCKQLAEMARRRGIAGWHDLRKEQLIEALLRSLRNEARRKKPTEGTPTLTSVPRNTTELLLPLRVTPIPERLPPLDPRSLKDRLVLLARGPYWLSCHWDVAPSSVQRAEAALGQDWYGAKPHLRVYEVIGSDTGQKVEQIVRDIPIHGGVNYWYIDVLNPPRAYRVDLGYLTRQGRFFCLMRSDPATTPRPGTAEPMTERMDGRKAERLAAMTLGFEDGNVSRDVREFLEEKSRRPLGAATLLRLGSGGLGPDNRSGEFSIEVDADLLVYGRVNPGSRLQLQNHPIELNDDGSFALRFKLPEQRQVIRCVATSPDGEQERTVVVAVDHNIRHLEPAPLADVE